MHIHVSNDLSDLAGDTRRIATEAKLDMAETVKKNVEAGERYARGIARQASGPHGLNYFKRITGEVTSPLEGEFGPHAGGTPVGGGWRHGPPNTDQEKAADIVAPRFAKDVANLSDRWFW